MAILGDVKVTVLATDDITAAIEEIKKEIVAVDEARICQIVRAELEAWEKRQLQRISLAGGATFIHEHDSSHDSVRLPEGSSVFPEE